MLSCLRVVLIVIIIIFICLLNAQAPKVMNGGHGVVIGTPVIFPAADLIAGNTIILIPAQGTNTFIHLISLTLQYVPGTFPFGGKFFPRPFFGAVPAYNCTIVLDTSVLTPSINSSDCLSGNNSAPYWVPSIDLTINNGDNTPLPGGALVSATVTNENAGLLYAIGDTGSISCPSSTGDSQYIVTTIGAGGAVTGVTISVGGTFYTTQPACTTTVITGSGNSSLQLNVVAANGNGSVIMTPIYAVVKTF